MGILTNSEDPDVMLHNLAFHQGLNDLLWQNKSSERLMQYCLETIACNPSICTMDHPDFIVCSFIKNSLGPEIIMHIFHTFDFSTISILTLKAPIATKVVRFSRLLKCLRSLYGKQCGPRSDCSSLFPDHAIYFYT